MPFYAFHELILHPVQGFIYSKALSMGVRRLIWRPNVPDGAQDGVQNYLYDTNVVTR